MTPILLNLCDGPLPTVQLRHELPDGSDHIDWMIARSTDRQSPLISFRLPRPLTELSLGEGLRAESIDDHRAAWLEYEGPVSGNRGQVRRLARGRVTDASWIDRDRRLLLRIEWDQPTGPIKTQYLAVAQEESEKWQVISLARSQFARYQ